MAPSRAWVRQCVSSSKSGGVMPMAACSTVFSLSWFGSKNFGRERAVLKKASAWGADSIKHKDGVFGQRIVSERGLRR